MVYKLLNEVRQIYLFIRRKQIEIESGWFAMPEMDNRAKWVWRRREEDSESNSDIDMDIIETNFRLPLKRGILPAENGIF